MTLKAIAFFTRKNPVLNRATLLNFSFIAEGGETVSFTLNTSISLKRKRSYFNAVSRLKINGLPVPGRFDLERQNESGLTLWGVHWWSGGITWEVPNVLTEQLSAEPEAYRSFIQTPETCLWGKRNNSFREECIKKLQVKHYAVSTALRSYDL